MAGVAWPFNETGTTGAPAVTARQLRQMHSSFVAMGTAARPLGAKSGIRVGTPSSVVSITGSGPYTWNAGGFGGVIDGEANAAAGPYTYSFETTQTGSIAASGAAARQDRLDVQISDSDEGDGSGAKAVNIIYTQGAATGGALPAAPPRSHRLATINVPTSGAPTITWAPEWSSDPGEWTFNTLAERDAYVTAIGSVNVPLNQIATVVSDPTSANNTVFTWAAGAWAQPDTGWIDATTLLTANWSAYQPATYGNIAYRKIGNAVYLRGVLQAASGASGSNVLTLPAGFRPAFTIEAPIDKQGTYTQVTVGANGVMGFAGSFGVGTTFAFSQIPFLGG